MFILLLTACDDHLYGLPADPALPPAPHADSQAPAADSHETGETVEEFCADAPLLNYANFGQGFILENCQGCHSSATPERYGAPTEAFFDTVEDCWTWSDRILARSAGEDATMPPQGGVSDDDRVRLQWWLLCAEEGT